MTSSFLASNLKNKRPTNNMRLQLITYSLKVTSVSLRQRRKTTLRNLKRNFFSTVDRPTVMRGHSVFPTQAQMLPSA